MLTPILPQGDMLVSLHGVYMNQVLGASWVADHGKPAPVAVSPCAAAEQLIPALQAVARGEMLLDPASGSLLLAGLRLETRGAAADTLAGLKEQERKVLVLAAQGHTAAQIGKLLFLSPKTVESYRSRAMQKLGLASRAELIAFALRVGLLST